MMKRSVIWIWLWAILFGVAGCAPAPSRAAITPSLAPALTATQALPSPTPTTTPQPEPSATPAPVDTPTPGPTGPACWQQGGHYETAELETELLKRYPLEVRVYLPPCYAEQPGTRYPVLYLLHGQSFTHDQWDRLGVDEHLDALIGARELPPFLVVMPRDREWLEAEKDPFGKAFIEALLPWVDATYRTQPERAYRAVGGLSRGAGWAVHFGLLHWDQFSAIGAHSLPVFWSDIPQIKGWLSQIPPESMPRIFLDIGDRDLPQIRESATWFEALLTQQGIVHEWYLYSGYHDEAYWAAHLEQYLRWYAQGFPAPAPPD